LGIRLIRRKSVGSIVFRREGKTILYLLLHYESGHWDYVKGGVEEGEDEIETMRREAAEEAGIRDLVVVPGFRETIGYFFREGKELVRKEVVFYLAETKTTEVKLSFEHKGFDWLPFGEARERLTYKNAKEVLEKADAFLKEERKRPVQTRLA